MRPQLAVLCKVTVNQLPLQPSPSSTLATLGAVLTIQPGNPPPGGGTNFHSLEGAVFGNTAMTGNKVLPLVFMNADGAADFIAPVPGPGTYLVTFYIDTTLSQVQVAGTAAGSGPMWEYGPSALLPVQNGKVFAVLEVTLPYARELLARIALPRSSTGRLCLYSCDFMRLK